MPNAEFLETYTLYNRFRTNGLPTRVDRVPKPAINMFCDTCTSPQTFNMVNDYQEGTGGLLTGPIGCVLRVVYLCSYCKSFKRYFLVKFDEDDKGTYITKVGQDPSWDITMDRNLEKELGEHANYYKRGLICESQSYGIGAFAYYRRIVEEIIDKLLEDISNLMTGTEKEKYLEALNQVRIAKRADEKIRLVKDLLPEILKPNNTNPLQILYEPLSEGLHGKTDEQCIVWAQNIRMVLVYLVNRLLIVKDADKDFTEGIKKLLDRNKDQSKV